jgi:hypothetical protein
MHGAFAYAFAFAFALACKAAGNTNQKRPMCMAKETYVRGKRDLCAWQKRPMCMAKEPYVRGKRDLCAWQKSPTAGKLPAEDSGVMFVSATAHCGHEHTFHTEDNGVHFQVSLWFRGYQG